MRIAFLTDGIYPYELGGMQRHSTNMLKYLVLNGVEVTLFHAVNKINVPSEAEILSNLFPDVKPENLKVIGFNFPSSLKFPGHYFFNSYNYSVLVYKALLENDINKFDFIYAKGFSAWRLLKEKKRKKNLPLVGVNFHGFEMWQIAPSFKSHLIQFLFRPFVKWNVLNADYAFSYGAKITTIILSLGLEKNKIIEIPSAVDKSWVRKTNIFSNKKLKFLFVGRYERRKAIEEINSAIHRINFLDIDVEFHFIGPIPVSKKIEFNNVIYHGKLTDSSQIISIIDSCDVLLCPSFSEGMPNVILEAMSRGLAIIGSNVGAVSLIVDNSNGFILEKNNVNSIVEAIKSCESLNTQELNVLKENSLEKITKQFTWDIVIKDLINKLAAICTK